MGKNIKRRIIQQPQENTRLRRGTAILLVSAGIVAYVAMQHDEHATPITAKAYAVAPKQQSPLARELIAIDDQTRNDGIEHSFLYVMKTGETIPLGQGKYDPKQGNLTAYGPSDWRILTDKLGMGEELKLAHAHPCTALGQSGAEREASLFKARIPSPLDIQEMLKLSGFSKGLYPSQKDNLSFLISTSGIEGNHYVTEVTVSPSLDSMLLMAAPLNAKLPMPQGTLDAWARQLQQVTKNTVDEYTMLRTAYLGIPFPPGSAYDISSRFMQDASNQLPIRIKDVTLDYYK